MDPRLETTRLHGNDNMPSLDIDLAAQKYPDDYGWTDAYGQEVNVFTPMGDAQFQDAQFQDAQFQDAQFQDAQFQCNVDQVDMGVMHGNSLGLQQSIETEFEQHYGSDVELLMTPPPSDLTPGNTPKSPPSPAYDVLASYASPGSSQLFPDYEPAFTNSISAFSQDDASFTLPPAPSYQVDRRMPSSPSPIDNGRSFNRSGKRIAPHPLSNHEAVLTGTFLDFLRMEDINPQTHAALTGILATKGFKLLPISRSHRKRSFPSGEMTTPKRRKLNSSNWWGQFLKIDHGSHQLRICEEGQALLDDPSTLLGDMYGTKTMSLVPNDHVVVTSDQVLVPSDQAVVPSDQMVEPGAYGKLFLYTIALSSVEFRTDVMQIVMRLFYYIISHNSTTHFVNSPTCRLPKMFPEDIGRLHKRLEIFLPSDCATLDGFKEKLKDLRSQGSSYAFLAKNLGLGSLIVLKDLLPPNKMWACTKGSEKSGISDRAFAHLKFIGVPAQAASIGADKVMHTLLWELCSTAPGFPKRKKRLGEWEPFPGFEYTVGHGMEREMGEVVEHEVGEDVALEISQDD